jgi:hypothetical protein
MEASSPTPSILDDRDQRALYIAANRKIMWIGSGVLRVQSQTSEAFYECEVRDGDPDSCECPDFTKRRGAVAGKACKHPRAARLILADYTAAEIAAWPRRKIIEPSPRLVAEAASISDFMYAGGRRRPPIVIAYPKGQKQESARRSSAYTGMRERVPQLLADLCSTLEVEQQPKWGGQELPLHDRLFAVVFRAFANRSYDDTRNEMKNLRLLGLVTAAPCKNSLSAYFHDPALTPVLREALTKIAKLVRKLETMALVDSTGLASCMTQVYLDTGRGKIVIRLANRWRKAHIVCGGVTGVIADVVLSDHERGIDNSDEDEPTADVNFWSRLVETAARIWPEMKYALGDKAYLSDKNIATCDKLGIKACIPIKAKWNPKTKKAKGAADLFEFYTKFNAAFESIYRYRSKVEGTFSAIKRTMGSHFRSHGTRVPKNTVPTAEHVKRANIAYENELLAKCVAYSLRRVVVLEHLHDEIMSFSRHTSFSPLRYKKVSCDLDKSAADDDFGSNEERDSAA